MKIRSGVKLISLIPGSGYGDSACEYAAGLDNLGWPVSWMPVRDNTADLIPRLKATRDVPVSINQQMQSLWNRDIDAEVFLLDVPPWRWQRYWLEAEPELRPYCYAAWETNRLPAQWPECFNHYEGIFVPSQFNKAVFEASGIHCPIHLLPHVARTQNASDEGLDLGAVNDEDFVFYTIGAWTTRKAMGQTVRAYLDAFSAEDPVALVIKTDAIKPLASQRSRFVGSGASGWQLTTAWSLARILADYPKPAKIHLVSGRITPGQIDQLHRRGDCFISLSHSEGWGLGAFDAALAAKPVIITGWGGQLDYLGKDYPYLVDYSLRSTDQYPDDGYFLHAADALWAEASNESAISLMRAVVEDPARANLTAGLLQPILQNRYAAAIICAELADTMGLSRVAE